MSVGIKALHPVDRMALVFGGFIVITGDKMRFASDQASVHASNAAVKTVRRRLRPHDEIGTRGMAKTFGASSAGPAPGRLAEIRNQAKTKAKDPVDGR